MDAWGKKLSKDGELCSKEKKDERVNGRLKREGIEPTQNSMMFKKNRCLNIFNVSSQKVRVNIKLA